MIALTAALRGLGKIEADPQRMAQDLDNSWEVLAEPIQTILRQEGVDQPYERLKEATRGRHLDAQAVAELLEALPLSAEGRARLQALTPATYLGLAETLARSV
jgi:adenylosuccinate lyase